MNSLYPSEKIVLGKSKIFKAGRGVFAKVRIQKDEIIEICPVLVLPRNDYPIIKKTVIRNYHFMWGKVTSAICFGFGSFYNHSYAANATYEKKIKDKVIIFRAVKDINRGDEILVNYNYGRPNSKKKLWIKEIKRSD